MKDVLRVLLADDHPVFRDGARGALALAPEIEVVGEAGSGEEAVSAAFDTQPDVVVMDLQMPGFNGVEATRRIVVNSPNIRVLVLTMFEDDASVFSAMRAGARGYVLKGVPALELVQAVIAIGRGEAIFSPAIASRMIDYFSSIRPTVELPVFPELSDREREVLEHVARGMRNADIAARLYLSPKTVRNYVSNIFDKLQFADRAEAIVRARQAGLGEPSP